MEFVYYLISDFAHRCLRQCSGACAHSPKKKRSRAVPKLGGMKERAKECENGNTAAVRGCGWFTLYEYMVRHNGLLRYFRAHTWRARACVSLCVGCEPVERCGGNREVKEIVMPPSRQPFWPYGGGDAYHTFHYYYYLCMTLGIFFFFLPY